MSCLDSLTMAAWVEGTLADAERGRALGHIADCAVCREVVSALMLAAQDTPEAARRARLDAPIAMPTSGATLGRYQIEGVIASGGMGVVLTAADPTLQRKVAIKVRRPVGVAQAPKLEARLIQEARALAQLRHPNVVAVYDAGRDGDHLFVVMELVEGESLRAWLTRRHRWQDGLRVTLAAGRGLEALHHAGLAHRDVKPDNVLLAADGRVLLADLGLAVQTAGADGLQLTADGAVVGTPRYLAPEQLAGSRGDPRSDQFSFAVVLREALAASDEPPPAWLRAVIQRAMDPDPIQRFASMTELMAALDRPPRRRRAALGIAALATGAVALAWSAWPVRTPEPSAAMAIAPRALPPAALEPDAAAPSAAAPAALGAESGVTRQAASRGKPQTIAQSPQPREPTPGPPSTAPTPPRSGPPPAATAPGAAANRTPATIARPLEPPLHANPDEVDRQLRQTDGPVVLRPEADPLHFQPSTYFATAQRMARTLMVDAAPVGAHFGPVSSDGSVDLSLAAGLDGCDDFKTCDLNVYRFRSPSQSRPAPGGDDPPRACEVSVLIYAQSTLAAPFAVAMTSVPKRCDAAIGPPPRCTLSQVWAAARRLGAPANATAKIQWSPGSGWSFSTRPSPDAPGFERTIPDRC